MKYIITGCAGFIGFHLAKKILEKGYTVYGLDNLNNYYDINLKIKRLNILKKFKKFNYYKINLENEVKLKKFIQNKKNFIFVHLAAQAGVRLSKINPKIYFKSNIKSFFNILECLKTNRPKMFIFASSSSVYGDQLKYPVAESANINKPLSFYGATKSCNEIMAYSYSMNYNIKTIGLRFFSVYGPYGRPDMAYFKFTHSLLNNKKFTVFNNGNFYRDFTYIDDVIKSILLLIKKSNTSKKQYDIFNIGRSRPIFINKFIETIIKNLKINNVKRFNLPGRNIEETFKTYSNSKKLHKYINFKPKVDLNKGINYFLNWYKKNYH